MPIKVCVITSVHPRFDTRIFNKECLSLVRSGYDVSLIVADGLGDEEVNNLRILDVGLCNNSRVLRMSVVVWRTFKKTLEIDPEIIHLHDPELMWMIPFLRLLGKKVIFDMHEDLVKQMASKAWIVPFFRKPVAYITGVACRLFLSNVSVVFAETSYAKSYPWINRTVDLLNMPLVNRECKSLSKRFNHNRISVGYIGRVSELRGSLDTVRALNLLNDRGVDAHWECVGQVSPSGHKKEMLDIAKPDVVSNIIFHGRMSSVEGLDIISSCDIGLALLHPIPNYLESYPTKMFEYMMLGIPVIASNFPLYRKIIENVSCGIVVDPQNSEEIANAIKWLMDHPDDAVLMGQNGMKAVSTKYNWVFEEQKLLVLYKGLI